MKSEFVKKHIKFSEEVKEAITHKRPLVALESTIITHGMPYPDNVKTALVVEEIIRKNGVTPATIALIDGIIRVGLSENEIKDFARKEDVVKTSRRDLPIIITKQLNGATTVAGTMIIANLVGIKVFVTGGIGGVHRGATETMDISADLIELAKTDVAVICAGAKSILDIGLTLEYLETNGVPVIGYQTEKFPAFYSRDSGFNVDYRIDTPKEIAEIINLKWKMGLNGGVVIANPIPDVYAVDIEYINNYIETAIQEAKEHNITGKSVTPYLLDKIKKMTGGKSLDANIELIKNNALLGAKIAIEYDNLLEI